MQPPTENAWQTQARRVAHGIRRQTLALTIERNGCYLSQALSSADILATLYTRVLNLGPSQAPMIPPPFPGVPGPDNIDYLTGAAYNGPQTAELDRFLISPAHYAVAVYAALVEVGRLERDGLFQFNTDGSTVEMIGAEHSPGFELTTGSFGQALSQAGGIALARRVRGETGRVFVFMSDGELEEGQTWEAIQALAFYKLDNVVVYVDVNGQQVDGLTKDVMNIEPISTRLTAFGATAVTVDGHNVDELAGAATTSETGKPHFVLAYTNPSQGIPLLDERKPKLHFIRFKDSTEKARFQDFLAEMEATVYGNHQ
jgi:transketolase